MGLLLIALSQFQRCRMKDALMKDLWKRVDGSSEFCTRTDTIKPKKSIKFIFLN